MTQPWRLKRVAGKNQYWNVRIWSGWAGKQGTVYLFSSNNRKKSWKFWFPLPLWCRWQDPDAWLVCRAWCVNTKHFTVIYGWLPLISTKLKYLVSVQHFQNVILFPQRQRNSNKFRVRDHFGYFPFIQVHRFWTLWIMILFSPLAISRKW